MLIKNEVPQDILIDFLQKEPQGSIIYLKIKPNAKEEKLSLCSDGLLLCVKAQALENAANQRVIELLSSIFSLAKKNIIILNGHTSRYKRILLKSYSNPD